MEKQIKTDSYLAEGFRELDEELHHAMAVLTEAVPLDQKIIDQLSWLEGDQSKHPASEQSAESAQLHSLAFELLNMVEEDVASRFRTRRRIQHGSTAVSGLWPDMIRHIAASGCTEDEAIAKLKEVCVEPVLTAHPTESKRPEVREKHLAIYRRLTEWSAVRDDPSQSARMRRALRAELEALWFTGEIFIQRPRVENELRNAIYYLREVFPDVVVRLARTLEEAWSAQGWSVEKLRAADAFPRVRFATWIGGDRDGHPLVTPEVTKGCLDELRAHAARLHRRWLRAAAETLPLASPFTTCPENLKTAIHDLAHAFGDTGSMILARNENKPWRAWLYLLREKVGRLPTNGGYRNAEEYRQDLVLIQDGLHTVGAKYSAIEFIRPLLRLLDVFGFHLAALDVRQNSATHDEAFALILEQAGVEDGADFATWTEDRRQELLTRELHNPRPFLARNKELPETIQKVVAPLKVLANHAEQFGDAGLGQLIVSMTRQASDLLLVHILCREAGLAEFADGRWRAKLPVTPLFETEDDLKAASTILESYFEHAGTPARVQPAMVGYSDSNKDAGVFSSQWGIYRALERITKTCRAHEVLPQYFHGRGGTIGRGAGPTQWFLRALPPSSLCGPVRLTEQGEVLPRKYAHQHNANYHLELLVAGVSAAVCTGSRATEMTDDYRAILDHISTQSTHAYQELIKGEGFIDFYRAATPIDALEAGTFGSRPPRRRGSGAHSLDDLRAIPWVFSWTQSRAFLPGWFGVGSGLASLGEADPVAYKTLQEQLPQLPFLRYVLTNVESSLAGTHLDILSSYAGLCEDEELRERHLTIIRKELDLTRHQIASLLGGQFSKRRPRLHHTVSLRDSPLLHLHNEQINLLRKWRQEGRPVADEEGRLDESFLSLQLNINAIASGLRETG